MNQLCTKHALSLDLSLPGYPRVTPRQAQMRRDAKEKYMWRGSGRGDRDAPLLPLWPGGRFLLTAVEEAL